MTSYHEPEDNCCQRGGSNGGRERCRATPEAVVARTLATGAAVTPVAVARSRYVLTPRPVL